MQSITCGNQYAYHKWFIGNIIRAILLADDDIRAQVDENIYPLVAPENVKGDFIIYARDSYSKKKDMHTNIYQDECIVNLVAIADNYDNAIALASKIDNALTGTHISDEGERIIIELSDSTETFEDNKYLETLSFKIK